jgi:hypothetical protein
MNMQAMAMFFDVDLKLLKLHEWRMERFGVYGPAQMGLVAGNVRELALVIGAS